MELEELVTTNHGMAGLLCLFGVILVPIISIAFNVNIWAILPFSILFCVIAYYVSGVGKI